MAIGARAEHGDLVRRLLGGVQPTWSRWLGRGDRSAIRTFLQAMSREDLALRFGAALSADRLALYAEGIDFERQGVWALGAESGKVLALVELIPFVDRGLVCAEVAFMVAPAARGRGFGTLLMEQALEIARERGIERLVAQVCPRNGPMLAILRAAGMRLIEAHGEVLGTLELGTTGAAGQAARRARAEDRAAPAGGAAAITA